MIRKILRLLAPLGLVLLLEAAFQAGIWEPMAKPASHAGTSVRLKRALLDPTVDHIDFVTLGSSRPEYGIDHALLASQAKRNGFVHADLSMPGSHWMTIGILTRWLARQHPEIRGGIIAMSIQDFEYPGNGSYELGIVYPFHRLSDIPWTAAHVPFDRGDIESYGTYSALFGWRQDIRDFVRNPWQRFDSIDWWAANSTTDAILFGNPRRSGEMCAFGVESLTACDRVDSSNTAQAKKLKRQCVEIRNSAEQSPNFDKLAQQSSLPAYMDDTRSLIQSQLLKTAWPLPPVVVLMPMPRVWTKHALPKGLHAWAMAVLQPLANEGRIRLIDATDFFASDADDGCAEFFDFYHENAAGRERFTQWLLPQLDTMLYQVPSISIAATTR